MTTPGSTDTSAADEVVALFRERGGSNYGKEAVTQCEHALQAAFFAERELAPASLIAAALLHDIGHLLHDLPENSPDRGIDDRHEHLATPWLMSRFGLAVAEPVTMHVDAKRYLCAVDPDYESQLSPPSIQSLKLQGGPMSAAEIRAFEDRRYFREAVRLRRWDDAAKIVGLQTPPIEHFARYLERAASETV